MENNDIVVNRVMYMFGETIVLIGLFLTLVGGITMIYSHKAIKDVEYAV